MVPDYIGVVAIGRNEGQRLIACLTSARRNASNIVYVDSGSTDDSIAAAEPIGAAVVKLDLSQPFTAARARNAGFATLRNLNPKIKFVQFVDGDCILVSGWLARAMAVMEQSKDIAVVCGRRREKYPAASVYNRICDIEWDSPIGNALFCGGDALVRVEAFEAVGGFKPRLIAGEEPEFCLRLREIGWRIWRLDAEMTQHDAAMQRFGQWWLRSVRCGYAYAEVSQLHWSSSFGLWKRETARAVLWGGVIPAGICLAAVVHPVAFAGALIFLVKICHIALSRGATSSLSWIYALFVTLAKFAEFQGVLKYYVRRQRSRPAALIEYK